MALVQKTKSLCNVPIFVHALIVIKDGPLVARPDKEVVAHTRVVKVVDHASKERREDFKLREPQPRCHFSLCEEPEHVVNNISNMHCVVVHVLRVHLALDHLNIPEKLFLVHLEVSQKGRSCELSDLQILFEDVVHDGEDGVAVTDLTDAKNIDIPAPYIFKRPNFTGLNEVYPRIPTACALANVIQRLGKNFVIDLVVLPDVFRSSNLHFH
mmetsp:Transcript_4385/g.15731  ORF Transcript_4385/g.15731 Transcript_4385/m.15731 type:complete len:212 (-) Transcript_4385:2431-3066(-)